MNRIRQYVIVGAVLAMAAVVPGLVGCKPAPEPSGGSGAEDNVLWHSELFDYAIDTLMNRLEELNSREMQEQTITRLDQWVHQQQPLADWQPDPMVAGAPQKCREGAEHLIRLVERVAAIQKSGGSTEGLGDEFRTTGQMLADVGQRLLIADLANTGGQMMAAGDQLDQIATSPQGAQGLLAQLPTSDLAKLAVHMMAFSQVADLERLSFPTPDFYSFQEAIWLRNIASWAAGEEYDDPVKPATSLFDWVVKNVDLQPEPVPGQGLHVLQKPWETLMTGRGTWMDRAWLFVMLARQANLDAALLGIPDKENELFSRSWAVGVLIEGEIYLYEPMLGLPVPKPGSWELGDQGLTVQPATLAEAAADDSILRQFDLLNEGDYAVHAEDLQRVVALVDASPAYLSQRMRMVEKRLTGTNKVILTTASTAQAERFEKCKHVIDARLWPLAYQAIWQEIRLGQDRQQWSQQAFASFLSDAENTPPVLGRAQEALHKGRIYHFKGQFSGKPSAATAYQAARQSDVRLMIDAADIDAEATEQLKDINLDASYWLGLMVAQSGNHQAAEDYLSKRVLLAAPGGKWETGAYYNLARSFEVLDNIPMAIMVYEATANSQAPGLRGNIVRSRWLKELTGEEVVEPKPREEPKSEEEPEPMEEPGPEPPAEESAEESAAPEAESPEATESGQDGGDQDQPE